MGQKSKEKTPSIVPCTYLNEEVQFFDFFPKRSIFTPKLENRGNNRRRKIPAPCCTMHDAHNDAREENLLSSLLLVTR